jgi:DNA-binding response OmpR family regulator
MIILLIEDNQEQAELIKTVLEQERYVVDTAPDGMEGLKKVEIRDYDLVIVDLELPHVSGDTIISRVRELELSTPILVLTANDQLGSKVNVLDAGADDYLTKPFAVGELHARVRALLRRPKEIISNSFKLGDLKIIYGTHEVQVNGEPVKLTKNEFRLLDYLMRKADRVCTRSMIQEHVWGYDQEHKSNLIEVVIYNLRKKLDRYQAGMIETVQNIGYRFKQKQT